jgi:hypothetical protein
MGAAAAAAAAAAVVQALAAGAAVLTGWSRAVPGTAITCCRVRCAGLWQMWLSSAEAAAHATIRRRRSRASSQTVRLSTGAVFGGAPLAYVTFAASGLWRLSLSSVEAAAHVVPPRGEDGQEHHCKLVACQPVLCFAARLFSVICEWPAWVASACVAAAPCVYLAAQLGVHGLHGCTWVT